MDDAELRRRLSAFGVGLFHAADAQPAPPGPEELAAILRALASSEDPRLVASLPCLFVRHNLLAADAVLAAAEGLDPASRERLGLAWRLARSFAVAREPDLRHLFGRAPRLPPLPFEPTDLPDPEEDFGERCPAVARELHDGDPGGNLAVDFVELFDAWLRLAETERVPAQHA